MNDNLIIIPSEDEFTEKISLDSPEISAEETLENILPAQENFDNPLAFNENIFKYIDSLQDAESLKEEILKISNVRIKKIFWESFKKFFSETSLVEKRRARLKCEYINRLFCSSIPLKPGIQRFVTPHHFYGIFISEQAVIGKGCTIFHHVTIGSNTLLDSKSAGTPVIGDNVYIGAGAKIIGNVKIGNNVRIGAGCCVIKDIPDNCTVAQAAPIIIQKNKRQNNRWFSIKDYQKIKAAKKN